MQRLVRMVRQRTLHRQPENTIPHDVWKGFLQILKVDEMKPAGRPLVKKVLIGPPDYPPLRPLTPEPCPAAGPSTVDPSTTGPSTKGSSMKATAPTLAPQVNEVIDRFAGHREPRSSSGSSSPPETPSRKSKSESLQAALGEKGKGREEEEAESREHREDEVI